MLRCCIFLIFLALTNADNKNVSTCYNVQANFDLKSVAGPWHVVAIVPGTKSSDLEVHCKTALVNFTEMDQSSLKEISTSKSFDANVKNIKGLIIRQDYDYGDTFYARAVPGVNGCFKKMFTDEISDETSRDDFMQLHILPTDDKSGPFLVQLLFGKVVSAAVFRKNVSVTQNQLKPVVDLLTKQRGPQETPLICDRL